MDVLARARYTVKLLYSGHLGGMKFRPRGVHYNIKQPKISYPSSFCNLGNVLTHSFCSVALSQVLICILKECIWD